MYLVAILFPPLAILLCGRIFQAAFSLLLLPFYFPSALWALLVVADHKANKRTDRLIRAKGRPEAVIQSVTVVNQVTVINQPPPAVEGNPLIDEMVADRKRQQTRQVQQARALEMEQAKDKRQQLIHRLTVDAPRQAFLAVRNGRSAAIAAYHELPEWAQPVTWGLAAGTPFAIIAVVLFMVKR